MAIVVVDATGLHIAEANNNSICRTLNPDGKVTGMCRDFCGTALDETRAVRGPVTYTCHAGLGCAAVPSGTEQHPLVTIVGRAFVKSENYRRATTRAIEGDWSKLSPADLFENVLMASSEDEIKEMARKAVKVIETPAPPVPPPDETKKHVESMVERFNREIGLIEDKTLDELKPSAAEHGPQQPAATVADSGEWRSFLSSLLKRDYPAAIDNVLGLLARQYGFSAMLWLDERDGRLETTQTYGEMNGRRVRLGISADDDRLLAAMHGQMPLELSEKVKGGSASPRLMNLFPIAVGDDILAAIAVLDPIKDPGIKKQIVRTCRTLAPQFEILRLRSEVALPT